ncbi:MAG TPA: phosphoribosylaminoimidazolesuccinocarboxamide synthase [Bacillota bacterium]|jgi:phosphoribosylaminoimidazole-succinocarboxamide synthase|nr:phosphoribosylaminoimidazolesuccinocarboxamide synthase [Bacillota bacterium]HQI15606.1 phosphoribosylaminoimidazolesuccinocarboxamide synthase [Bacillota bacterium]HQL34994.1 phosphoribosylaminoimidazolesuccinocarboxamide synthase [Bacillota bacterium]
MKRLEMIYEGKAKKVYKTDDEALYIVEYKDDATAFNGLKKGTITNKGIMNNRISEKLFSLLEEKGVDTHQVERISDREVVVKKVKIIPLEVLVRNYAAGSLSKRLGLEEGVKLNSTVLEFSYKNDELGDPMVNDYHIKAIGIATEQEVAKITEMALKINEILSEYMLTKGILLVDFKLEFGKTPDGKIILADEISPDTCRLWDAVTLEKMDKDRFRRDMGKVEEGYMEVVRRLC